MPRVRELVSAVLLTMVPGVSLLGQAQPHDLPVATTSLGPGDFILLKIWREPDLSDTVQVDNSGVAVFPKLGPIAVTGIRTDSLEHLLVHEYSRYLQNPSIKVTVLRRITIWGSVVRPGSYPVDLTMTITDAVALAGGASPDGKTNKVELRRGKAARVIDLSRGVQRVGDLALQSGDQLYVPQRSWVSRNPGLIVAAVGTVTSLVYLMAR
jgi:polysaccharide export outer membrane protein